MSKWEDYGDPVTTESAPASESAVDWEDVGKGAAGGLGRGVTGTLGIGGTIGDLTRAGLSKIGVPDRVIDAGAAAVRAMPGTAVFTGPSGADLQKKAEEYTGKFYEPHTKAGQYASTIAEFAPGAFIPGGGSITARAVNTIVPALASETAGQATKGSAWEPVARTVAGFGSGVGGARLVTPAPAPSRALQRATAVLDREGVPLSAGDRTGSSAVRWAEAAAADTPLSSGAAQTFRQNQSEALGRAVTNHTFDPAELQRRGLPADAVLPAEDVMATGRQSLSDRYTDLSQRNAIVDHPEIHLEMYDAQRELERASRLSQRHGDVADIQEVRNRITDALNRGSIPGDVYQATRSDLGRDARSLAATNPHLSTAYDQMRAALDRGMERSLSPADAAAWRQNNQRWANMKAVTSAAATSPEYFTPKGLASSVRTGRTEQYARNAGDLDELARSASIAIKSLPNSGTAQRTGWQNLFNAPNILSASGSGVLGTMFGLPGAVAGAVAPHLVGRAIWSGPGQRYLSNQALPQTNRDLITQMLVQQAGSQPAGIERNKAEREAYNKKQAQKYRDLGL